MIRGAENIRLGSIIFIGGTSMASWLIKMWTKSEFSHVAVYIGMGEIIESTEFGVKKSKLCKYLGDDTTVAEVVTLNFNDIQLSKFISFIISKLHDEYDYLAVMGHIFSRLFNRLKKWLWLFNRDEAWLCSELVAAGLKHAGISLPKMPVEITPKDLYLALTQNREG